MIVLAGSSGAESGPCPAEFGSENLEGNLSRVTGTPPAAFLILVDTMYLYQCNAPIQHHDKTYVATLHIEAT